MKNIPNKMYSGIWNHNHVQGIAIDSKRGYVYYSFTTVLVKTDLEGTPIGTVIDLAGHLGCITYDAEKNLIYGSLELKHDVIGAGIIKQTGWDPSSEDSFYLVCFDCDAIDRIDMSAERDNVMKAVYLNEPINDYKAVDEVSGKKHRYGCSGIDGTGLGKVYGYDGKKILVAYGVYGDNDRDDNDYQVILQYDPDIVEKYGKQLNQAEPHHSGPESCERRYFFYTGNTTFGVQNLEYDEFSNLWYLAVYAGKKAKFENFNMFYFDPSCAPQYKELIGREGEKGLVLASAKLGEKGKQDGIYGSYFAYGSTGMFSMGDQSFYFSQNGRGEEGFFTTLVKYDYSPYSKYVFEENN